MAFKTSSSSGSQKTIQPLALDKYEHQLVDTAHKATKITQPLIFGIHEHQLKEGVDTKVYEQEVTDILSKLDIPGLLNAYFMKGIKGTRENKYTVVWIFESSQAVEKNFGTFDNPKWPDQWLHFENDVLAKYLTTHPDKIVFTDYQLIQGIEY